MSYLFQFTCPECGYEVDALDNVFVCPDCENPLLATYDLYRARKEDYLNHLENLPGMWQFMGLLPVQQNPSASFNFQEGGTPILNLSRVASAFGLNKLYIKHEGVNPAGNLADRGISVTYSTVEHPTDFYIEDNGTRVISASAYSALMKKKLFAVVPQFYPRLFMGECKNYGADLQAVKWNNQEIERVKKDSYQNKELFNLNLEGIPFFIEGAKTVFLELLWQFKFFLPEYIAIPTGDGLLAVALWKALDEFQKLGGIIKTQETQVYLIQHENTAPLQYLLMEEPWEPPLDFDTIAPDLFVRHVFFQELLKKIIDRFKWKVVTVSTEAIISTWKKFAPNSGFLLSAEGSAALAGIASAVKNSNIRNRNVLIINPSLGSRFIDTMGFIRD
ncbi:MAG: pyridoxal-phosphate dependent enzyme [Calditrichaeota bacterium]|nr:MAG: pyridoxal-phosphate dependent enzyme [Calditrichota bacterium]